MKYMANAFHSYTPFIILWLVLWALVIVSSLYCTWTFTQWLCKRKEEWTSETPSEAQIPSETQIHSETTQTTETETQAAN
jgi:type VI protein secretion system component VasK